MQSRAKTVEEYLNELPEERREAIEEVRGVILKNLDKDYEEGMQYGMIGYAVPHLVYPGGYHCDPKQPLPFMSLASQKQYMSLYAMCLYESSELFDWLCAEWEKTGKKLTMGKCCIRFKKVEELPLGLIGKLVKKVPAKKFIQQYEAALENAGRKRPKSVSKSKSVRKTVGTKKKA
ncbi:MAG: DUF1801 domain-containing protein [Planctomycetaceae bacterium]|nr:DUF1801 domain-containing protein [Planctomycetaceae bacterium]